MNEAVAANHAEQPLFDNAAMRDALAALRVSTGAGDVLRVAGSPFGEGDPAATAAREQDALPPKTVSQVLGEITWLMTQSPRHKVIPLGDLEWLLMPPFCSGNSGFSTTASSRSALRCGRWSMISQRSGSTPATTASVR
jgi:hypothetical protein